MLDGEVVWWLMQGREVVFVMMVLVCGRIHGDGDDDGEDDDGCDGDDSDDDKIEFSLLVSALPTLVTLNCCDWLRMPVFWVVLDSALSW